MDPIDDSDPGEHRKSEGEDLRAVEEQIGCHFTAEEIDLGEGVTVEIDGVNREKRVLCEVNCHMGKKLASSQKDKIAADVLKLISVDKALGGEWRKLLCFASDEAAAYCRGKSWLAAVIRQVGCEVRVVELPADRVRKLDERQRVKARGGLAALADFAESLPTYPEDPVDGAAQHDHYLYGSPKR